MPNLLESPLIAPFIPCAVDGLALSRHIVDDFIYLGPLVISFPSLSLGKILKSAVKMWPYSVSINGEFSQWHDRMVTFWIKEWMSKDSTIILWLSSLDLIGSCNLYMILKHFRTHFRKNIFQLMNFTKAYSTLLFVKKMLLLFVVLYCFIDHVSTWYINARFH